MPGCINTSIKRGKILYVGKAKNLKKRISSLFFRNKIKMVRPKCWFVKLPDIQTIVVASKMDALLLENSLIKKHQLATMYYLKTTNISWICIKKERFPRIFSTRKLIKDGSEYFGPYTSIRLVKTLLNLPNSCFQLRTCNYALTEENIQKEKFKVCLNHIGNCKAPCYKAAARDRLRYWHAAHQRSLKEISDQL